MARQRIREVCISSTLVDQIRYIFRCFPVVFRSAFLLTVGKCAILVHSVPTCDLGDGVDSSRVRLGQDDPGVWLWRYPAWRSLGGSLFPAQLESIQSGSVWCPRCSPAVHVVACAHSLAWTNVLCTVSSALLVHVPRLQVCLSINRCFCFLDASHSIIHQTMAIALSSADPRKQKYFVLLIITGMRCEQDVRK